MSLLEVLHMILDDSTSVYRIISIEAFLGILINKKERYVRPIDWWQDTFEGYMLHQLDTKASRRQVLERLYNISDKDINLMIRNLSKLLRSRYSCYAQCWSTTPDSDALWRIYAYNNRAIQLKSSVSNIRKMIDVSGEDGFKSEINFVKYDINDEEEALNKILVQNAKVDAAYFHKRPAFKHESEVRVLLNDFKRFENVDKFAAAAIRSNMKFADKSKPLIDQTEDALSYLIDKNGGYLSIAPTSVEIKIPVLSDYIVGVRVHPQAPDWYADLIKKVCRNYRIKYCGKSDLYRQTV